MSQAGSINNGSGPGSGNVRTLTGNTGGPVPPDVIGNIDVIGAGGITVAGNPGTNTLTISDGGSASTFIEDIGFANPIGGVINVLGTNVVQTAGNTSNTITIGLTEGMDGQVPIGATGLDPAWANITSLGATITITNGPNTINLETSGSGVTTFDADTGSATPIAGVINIFGGANINTSASVNTVVVNLDTSIDLPDTNVGFTTGTLLLNSVPFLHNFGGTGGGGGASSNIFLGESAGNDTLSTGTANIGIGSAALINLDTGTDNICIGELAGLDVVAGTDNIYIGNFAGGADGIQNVAVGGGGALGGPSTTNGNVVVGYAAGGTLTNDDNIAIGFEALDGVGDCSTTIAIGVSAGNGLAGATTTSNIMINNAGVNTDNNTIRIGTQGSGTGQQDACFIAGIYNTSVGATNQVALVDSSGQLGSSTGADGEILIGATAGSPAWSTITPGTNITITNAANSITIDATSSGGLSWVEVTGATVAMAVNTGYIMNNAGGVTGTLPATAAVGDLLAVVGKNAGGWTVAQNSGQTIHFGNMDTTTGATGTLSSTLTYDSFEIVCITANNDFVVRSSLGNITVV